MSISVFDLFRVGIGPSSSHTVGPMRAARRFLEHCDRVCGLDAIASVSVHLYGSLAATGVGHGTVDAVVLGLAGHEPHTVDPDEVPHVLGAIATARTLALLDRHPVTFNAAEHVHLHPDRLLPGHPNGMHFVATGPSDTVLAEHTYYSVGGGFVADDDELGRERTSDVELPHPFRSAADLLSMCAASGLSISAIARANERATRTDDEIDAGLDELAAAMRGCVERGCRNEGELPGGLHVQRRAAALRRQLDDAPSDDPLTALDWVNVFALAVNEENAAGGRVVTAPTNGAAGIVPAVMLYYERFVPGATPFGTRRYLLTAGAVGALCKMNASISGAEVGCQGEVGSACAMAAAGLAETMGGTPEQVENAAEIALEHNLGLTCDPIGGLVQVPCIERNAMAAMKAINAARLALRGDGRHLVSLDQAIATMRDTGRDMHDKYKETARGGLALTVTVVDC